MTEPTGPARRRRPRAFALRATLGRRANLLLGLALPLAIGGLWCAVSYGGLVGESFLPTPTQVVRGVLQLFFEQGLGSAIVLSTARILIAFSLAVAVALPLGVAMGAFAPVHRLFEPIVAPLRYMPISAFIPLLILWFGIQEGQKVAFLFLGVFVYLLPVVVSAVRAVPEEHVQTAYTLGATPWQVIRTVLVPAALPDIFDSFRVMNAISWTYVILAEAVNPSASGWLSDALLALHLVEPGAKGLGYLTQLGYTHSRPAWSLAGLIVIGGIGLATDFLIRALSRALFRWREAHA